MKKKYQLLIEKNENGFRRINELGATSGRGKGRTMKIDEIVTHGSPFGTDWYAEIGISFRSSLRDSLMLTANGRTEAEARRKLETKLR